MVHYAYEKAPDEGGWYVKAPPGSKYQGSRQLGDYAKAAAKYGKQLHDLIPQIKMYISEQTTRDTVR
jgi:hypothetical protein